MLGDTRMSRREEVTGESLHAEHEGGWQRLEGHARRLVTTMRMPHGLQPTGRPLSVKHLTFMIHGHESSTLPHPLGPSSGTRAVLQITIASSTIDIVSKRAMRSSHKEICSEM